MQSVDLFHVIVVQSVDVTVTMVLDRCSFNGYPGYSFDCCAEYEIATDRSRPLGLESVGV